MRSQTTVNLQPTLRQGQGRTTVNLQPWPKGHACAFNRQLSTFNL
ncbi:MULTISPECIES: hypothetical protein [unclassified Moorena]|nr:MULTISPECIES: hypothetical protein [unclassified Moorena]